jgi:hypothetical protein
MQFPRRIFNFLINTLTDKEPEAEIKDIDEVKFDPEAILSFDKLQSLI